MAARVDPYWAAKPWVAFEESFYAVAWQIILGVQALGGVTVAAHIGGDFERGTASEANDLVLGMAIGAGRGVPVAGSDRFAVDALFDILASFLMTCAACLSQF